MRGLVPSPGGKESEVMVRPYEAIVEIHGVKAGWVYTRKFTSWAGFAKRFGVKGGQTELPWTGYRFWVGGHAKIIFRVRVR